MDPNKWEGTTEGKQLEDDLIRMGCVGLYEKPWIFQKGRAATELLPPGTPREVHRANPLTWTRALWRDVYSFAEEDWKPVIHRELLDKHLSNSYDVSECYHSEQFKNPRLRRIVGGSHYATTPGNPKWWVLHISCTSMSFVVF